MKTVYFTILIGLVWYIRLSRKHSNGITKEFGIDLNELITDLNKLGKSLGAILNQIQGPRSTVQTIVCK